ncbi:helix-turn-helix domain-containing protein [Pantoea rodasii]|uniref:helix-turn-helix domain-containing protein n=1 Tax=Pantoea rodasii TaxID=1076549 RepID=UPI0009077B0D|nr:AraC family transcriptional regulator [Pantoea rodasii]
MECRKQQFDECHREQGEGQGVQMLLRGDIALTSGTVTPQRAVWHDEQLYLGLKIIIIESGELLCRFPKQPERHIKGPALCAVWSQDLAEASQCLLPGAHLSYTAVNISTHSLTQHLCAESVDRLVAGLHMDLSANPGMRIQAAPKCLCGLRTQLFTNPLQGVARQLYMTGKALEIVAHTLDSLSSEEIKTQPSSLRLSTRDISRLHDVKTLLANRIDSPPSISDLSVEVGLNTRKLTAGFRRLFNQSIYGYLQTLRLETAWRMLSTGEASVSSVAYKVGYSPAHFSVAFRKKYGFAPKDMRC